MTHYRDSRKEAVALYGAQKRRMDAGIGRDAAEDVPERPVQTGNIFRKQSVATPFIRRHISMPNPTLQERKIVTKKQRLSAPSEEPKLDSGEQIEPFRRRGTSLMTRCEQLRSNILRKTIGVNGPYKLQSMKSLDGLMGEITNFLQRHASTVIVTSLFAAVNRLDLRAERILESEELGQNLAALRAARTKLRQEMTIVLKTLRRLESERQDSLRAFNATGRPDDQREARLGLIQEQCDRFKQLVNFWGRPEDLTELWDFLKHKDKKHLEMRDSHETIDSSSLRINEAVGSSPLEESFNETVPELPSDLDFGTENKRSFSREEVEALIERRIRDNLNDKAASNSRMQHPTAVKNRQYNNAVRTNSNIQEDPNKYQPLTTISRDTGHDTGRSLYEELFPDDRLTEKLELVSEDDELIPRLPLPKARARDKLSSNKVSDIAFSEPKQMPQFDPDKAAVLILYNASPSLSLSDFTSVLPPPSSTRNPWTSASTSPSAPVHVIPMRDPQTLERPRNSHYYLIFASLLAARTYRERAYHVYTLAKAHAPASIEAGVPPSPGTIVNGEDLFAAVKSFTLVPPSQRLDLRFVQPRDPMLQGLVRRGGYARVVGERGHAAGAAADGGAAKVLLQFYGGVQPSRQEIDEAIGVDIRARGLAWRLEGGWDGIRKVDVAKVDEDGAEDGEKKAPAANPKWILSFEDQPEARRFARTWHQRRMPWKNPTLHKGFEDKTMVKAELLW